MTLSRSRQILAAMVGWGVLVGGVGAPMAAGQMPLPAGEEEAGTWPSPVGELPAEPERLLAIINAAQTMDEAISARARLIEVAGDDDRAATWMVEQAAALLDRIAADGSDAAVLFGIATEAQRRSAGQGATEALELVARAEDAAARAVERVQARLIDRSGDPEAVRRRAESAERTLSRLVDLEQGVRIPFFRGRAAVILAALETGRAGREEFVRVTLESLARLRLGTVAAESSRRVALGAVLMMMGEGGAEQQRAQCRELLRWVVEQPVRGGAGGVGGVGDVPDPITRAQAWMGLMRAAGTVEEVRGVREALALAAITEPFVAVEGDERAADPLLALLTAEGAARARLAITGPAEEAEEAARLNEALAPLLALLTREDLREHRRALRPLVLAKVGSVTDRLMPMDRLDAMIPLARAVMLARSAGPGDPRRAEAAALLEGVAARGDAGSARPEALWELAVIMWESPRAADAVRAVEALCDLATAFPDSARAVEAAKKAVELSRYTLATMGSGAETTGGGGEMDAALRERLAGLYARSLELAVKLAPTDEGSSQQRLERARLVLDAAASGTEAAMTPEELDTALSALEGIAEDDPRRAEADVTAAAAIDRALEAARGAVARAVAADGGRPALAPAARERQIGIARRAVGWAQQRRPREADRYRLVLADALVDGADARAAAVYQDIADRAPAGSELSLRARLGLGRAQRVGKQSEEAFATLRSLVDDLERAAAKRRPATAERHETYWLAWAEMLEILASDNRDGRRTDVIRLQLNRLALVDPSFGGGEARRRIEAVRGSVQSR